MIRIDITIVFRYVCYMSKKEDDSVVQTINSKSIQVKYYLRSQFYNTEVSSTTVEAPSYWGSWKGRVIKAIALDGARTWNDIRELTGLSLNSLNIALSEMFDLGILKKRSDGTYRVSPKIYKEYKRFFERKGISKETVTERIYQKTPVKFSNRKRRSSYASMQT